jgi:hypothetical protein
VRIRWESCCGSGDPANLRALARRLGHSLPFSAWSLSKLGEFLVAEGVVDDISHEGLRVLLREEGVTFQRLKTWKASTGPHYAVKKARIEHLYAIADRESRTCSSSSFSISP